MVSKDIGFTANDAEMIRMMVLYRPSGTVDAEFAIITQQADVKIAISLLHAVPAEQPGTARCYLCSDMLAQTILDLYQEVRLEPGFQLRGSKALENRQSH